jgi:hypothetical protein
MYSKEKKKRRKRRRKSGGLHVERKIIQSPNHLMLYNLRY